MVIKQKKQLSCLYLTHAVQRNRCTKTELLASAIQQRLTGVVQKQTRKNYGFERQCKKFALTLAIFTKWLSISALIFKVCAVNISRTTQKLTYEINTYNFNLLPKNGLY